MASTLIAIDDLRYHVETGLPDTALERVVDQMDALIVERHGAHTGPLTETVYPYGYDGVMAYHHLDGARTVSGLASHFRVARPIDTITSITAYDGYHIGATATVVPSTEYRVEGRTLVRLMQRWPPRVVVEYTPVDNTASRQRVLIQLVRAELRWAPVLAEGVDGATVSYRAYDTDQRTILESLREGLV